MMTRLVTSSLIDVLRGTVTADYVAVVPMRQMLALAAKTEFANSYATRDFSTAIAATKRAASWLSL